MIKTFKGKGTEKFFESGKSDSIPQVIHRRAMNALKTLNAAVDYRDLMAVKSFQFEALKGKKSGSFSIRVNQQYRVVFSWKKGDAYDVEIKDYHGEKNR